jgi:hypothetical protein
MDPPVARLSRALNRAFMSSYLLPRSGHACGSSRTVGNAEVGIRQRHTLAEATICSFTLFTRLWRFAGTHQLPDATTRY